MKMTCKCPHCGRQMTTDIRKAVDSQVEKCLGCNKRFTVTIPAELKKRIESRICLMECLQGWAIIIAIGLGIAWYNGAFSDGDKKRDGEAVAVASEEESSSEETSTAETPSDKSTPTELPSGEGLPV